jgi:nucleotide-binding universal stress UspA family protein
MQMLGPVLVAADLVWDAGAEEALRAGDNFARAFGVPLMVCHVLTDLPGARPLFPQLHLEEAFALSRLEAQAQARLAQHVRGLTGRAESEFQVVIASGSPHAGILGQAEAARAGLLVIAAHGEAKRPGLLGGVTERVVRNAGCPVLVARPSGKGQVLGATDFSDPALPAVDAAASEAKRRGAALALIHCFDFVAPVVGPAPEITDVALQALDEMRATARRRLEETAARRGGEAVFRDGPAAAAIVETAGALPAELVVVGTHGRTGLKRLALGSVAEQVIRRAPCSVLVVRLSEA